MKTKKKIYIIGIILAILIAASAIYLNRAYAHIYNTIGEAYLRPPSAIDTMGESTSSSRRLIYVALGDSLTAGTGVTKPEEAYPYLVGQALSSRGADVVVKNFSVPGARTEYLNTFLLAPAIGQKPDIVTVLVGVNDMHGNLTVNQFTQQYEYLLQQLTTQTTAKIYLVNIPYLGTPELLWAPYNFYFDYRTKVFNKVIKKLADQYHVNYIDLYSPTVTTFKKSGPQYSADLFHPSAQGYSQWATIISHDINY